MQTHSNQEQLKQLFNASPLPAVLYSRGDGRILDVNNRFLQVFEITREEAIGQTGWELGIWCDLEQRNQLVTRVRQHGRVDDFEARVRTRAGREFQLLLSAQVIDLPGGPAVIVQGNDVTDRNSIEQRLRENESRYRSVVEGSLQGILIHQEEHICYANAALARMFGYDSPEELLGRPLWDTFVLPENREELEDRTRRLLAGERVPPHPGWRAVGKTGRSIWVSTSASRIEWQGRPAIVAFYLDVSERRRAEDALRESEAFLRLSQRVGKVGSWQWDLQTNHVRWSEVMYDLYGTTPEDFDGTLEGAIRHTHPDDRPAVQASIERIIRTGEAGPIEYRVIKPDGQIANLWGHGEILRDQTSRPVQVIGTVTDITERKQAEGALRESEARFRQLFEHSPDAIFVEDLQGQVLDVNPAACRLHGVDRGELIGKNVFDLVPTNSRADVARDFPKLVQGELDHAEGLSRHADGRAIPVAIRASRTDFSGRPALLLHVRDVTEQKQSEQALRESEARLRTMLESLDNVAVQAYESDGTITFWNRASERLYGYLAEQALGRDMIELLHPPATRAEERQIMAEAIATAKIVPAQEVEVVTRDGRRVCIIASRILHARPGRPPEFFCFDVDITDRKRAEEELALRQAELLHAARLSSVGQMVAALSHEVAQPLSAIANFTAACGLLLESNSRESWELLKEYNQAIGKQNQRCGAILERLRHFSRRSPAHRSPSDINHLVRESVELIAHELRREGVKIGYELTEGLPPVVCDRVQLEQVIVNLLANARDALRDQPVGRRQISIRSHRDQAGLAVEFEDSGSGLAPDVMPRMFEPFFTTKADGMGIGLSICRTIMRDHGGNIEATNGPREGALFRLRLPTLEPQKSE